MNLNDLLQGKGIDPKHVLVFRHRPKEPRLRDVLPWLAAERPELFNAYQQSQYERVERIMAKMNGTGHVASFIGIKPGTALFVGLYSIAGSRPLTYEQFWRISANRELETFGMPDDDDKQRTVLWFDLRLTEFYKLWKGKLIIGWPGQELVWCRRAHKNEFPVLAILEDSALDAAMRAWDAINLTWEQLRVLPTRWKSKLSEWRGIYYVFDASAGKGYVGSAYGKDNLLQRWKNWAARGHGGNKLLRHRDPDNFRFTILQRVSPDMEAGDVIRLESSWKSACIPVLRTVSMKIDADLRRLTASS